MGHWKNGHVTASSGCPPPAHKMVSCPKLTDILQEVSYIYTLSFHTLELTSLPTSTQTRY